MSHVIAFAGVVTCVVGGCALDPLREQRPARLTVGMSTHHFSSSGPGSGEVAARTTTPPEQAASSQQSATTASAQFTMAARNHLYAGGEVEAGKLQQPGSNVAGIYAVVGAEATSRFGALGVELAGGWRTLRYSLDEPDTSDTLLEPRVRANVWLSSQVTLGAAAGATLDDRGWMAGVYVAVHSSLFGTFR